MKRFATPALALCALTTSLLAQETMKPGPEHARIGYFVGTWQLEGETAASPMGPGQRITGTETCEWFAGGFQLICQGDVSGPRGAGKSGSVWTYDPAQRRYTYYLYNSLGESFYVLGSVEGKVWTWNAELPMEGGGTMKLRATLTEQPPVTYAYRVETSPDGATWTVVEEGQATKKPPSR